MDISLENLNAVEERIKKLDKEFHSFPSKETWRSLSEAKKMREEILRLRKEEKARQDRLKWISENQDDEIFKVLDPQWVKFIKAAAAL